LIPGLGPAREFYSSINQAALTLIKAVPVAPLQAIGPAYSRGPINSKVRRMTNSQTVPQWRPVGLLGRWGAAVEMLSGVNLAAAMW
jgi:hypothetical protein